MTTSEQEPPAPEMPGSGQELAEIKHSAPLAVQVLSDDEIRRTWRIASALAQSGMFKDARQAEQAFAKILIGRDLGLTPAQAMTGIHIVEGKPELAAVTLAGFVGKREGYDYRVQVHTAEECSIEFYRDGDCLGVSEFTIADAERAGIAGKDNYKKWPRNMLYARAMSNGVRWFCPEVVGGVPVYVEGELDHREAVGALSEPEPVGIDLGPKVEAVLARASELGHAGLADRATAEMAVGGMSPKDVEMWVANAAAELDGMAAPAEGEPAEAKAVVGRADMDAAAATPEPADAEVVCGAPDTHREGVVCEQPAGHDGAHAAAGETWEPFLAPDADERPPSEAVAKMRAQANALADEAIAAREAGDESKAQDLESEAEALNDAAEAASDPAQTGMEV